MARQFRRLRAGPTLAVGLTLALISFLALAGSNITILPNGAELKVSIDDPETCTEFLVPAGQSTIDVDVSGTASVGLGEPRATLVYVMDVSGSTDVGEGTGCSPVLDCEQEFVKELNQAAIDDGSVDEVGLVVYADSAATGDMKPDTSDQKIVDPDADSYVDTVVNSTFSDSGGGDGGVDEYTNKKVGQFTNCAAGLEKALEVVNASIAIGENTVFRVVFVSDGFCNLGGQTRFNNAVTALDDAGATVFSIAIGEGNDCDASGDDGNLRQMAVGTGGACEEIEDPGELPDIIPSLIGSTLESLEIEVDGGGKLPIPNSDISLPLPQDGKVEVTYTTNVSNLDPDDHTICVTANGTDVTGGVVDVTQCETIHLLQLTASPTTEVNDLNFDDEHTVTGEIVGGSGPERDIEFEVSGQNAETADPGSSSIPASPNLPVDFVYTVPQDCASLGTDTITVSTTIAGTLDSIDFTKEWIDEVPPEVSCDPSVNPHGKEPQAPGKGGQGQNPDGFYQLNAQDPNLANCTVTLEVVDGSGFVFPGPFLPGDVVKYTQADGAPQQQKKMGSDKGQAGAVSWHLMGHGDLTVTGTDPSGNTSSATCLVPPPPK